MDVEFKSASLLSRKWEFRRSIESTRAKVSINIGAIGPWVVRPRFLCLAVPFSREYTLPFDVRVCGEDKARNPPPVSLPLLVFASNSPRLRILSPVENFSLILYTAHSTYFLRLSNLYFTSHTPRFPIRKFASISHVLLSIVYLFYFSELCFVIRNELHKSDFEFL